MPLRILIQKQNEGPGNVFVSMLQIELIGYTHVRAHDLNRSESSSWVIISHSNMRIPIGSSSDPSGKEWKVPSHYWENAPIPNTVAPSFNTCNISRTYVIEVRIGLTLKGEVGGDCTDPDLIVLPLRLSTSIFSGIAPPPALLRRMTNTPCRLPSGAPSGRNPSSQGLSSAPPGTSPSWQPPPEEVDDVAPPSYEDAMADEIGPVDGPRRNYSIPPPLTDPTDSIRPGYGQGAPTAKGAYANNPNAFASATNLLGRRVSERLFPTTAGSNPDFPSTPGYHQHSQNRPFQSPDSRSTSFSGSAMSAGVVMPSPAPSPHSPPPPFSSTADNTAEPEIETPPPQPPRPARTSQKSPRHPPSAY
jgi:hypothetical protein